MSIYIVQGINCLGNFDKRVIQSVVDECEKREGTFPHRMYDLSSYGR